MRKYSHSLVVIVTVFALVSSCKSLEVQPLEENRVIPPFASSEYLRFVPVGGVPDERMQDVVDVVTKDRLSVITKLGVTTLPRVSVFVWSDRGEFEEAYMAWDKPKGVSNGKNASFVRGFINSDNLEVHVFNTEQSPAKGAVHEFVHLVSLEINPNISSDARWLWETIAIYFTRRPPPPIVETLKCITSEGAPSLNELDEHPGNIYRVGFYLGEFIQTNWGWDGFRTLIKESGNTRSGLGISKEDFQSRWLEHLSKSHSLSNSDRQTDC